jgi:hypothetical protein
VILPSAPTVDRANAYDPASLITDTVAVVASVPDVATIVADPGEIAEICPFVVLTVATLGFSDLHSIGTAVTARPVESNATARRF